MAYFFDDQPGSERRRFRRIKTSSPIEYRFFKSDNACYSVTCDISEGGICFLVDGPIPIGSYLYFQVRLKNRPQPIYGIARVVWSSREPYSEKYRVGLEFTEVGSISKADICAFIQENKTSCFSY